MQYFIFLVGFASASFLFYLFSLKRCKTQRQQKINAALGSDRPLVSHDTFVLYHRIGYDDLGERIKEALAYVAKYEKPTSYFATFDKKSFPPKIGG
mgnify:CR=1 FL=1